MVCTPLSDGLVLDDRALVFESDTEMQFEPGRKLTLTSDPAFLVLFKASDGTALRIGEQGGENERAAAGALQRVGSL